MNGKVTLAYQCLLMPSSDCCRTTLQPISLRWSPARRIPTRATNTLVPEQAVTASAMASLTPLPADGKMICAASPIKDRQAEGIGLDLLLPFERSADNTAPVFLPL